MAKITKLVLPVAGLGKRLRPLTNRCPKALVPLRGRPLLDYMLEEAEKSGIGEVALVINPRHEKYFRAYLKDFKKRFRGLKIHLRFQYSPGGNGHAIIQAADVVKNEPFAVRFCDDIISCNPSVLASLIQYFKRYRAPILLLERVPKQKISSYGVVAIKKARKPQGTLPAGNLYRITEIIEKPSLLRAPSNLSIVGGYILTPAILRNLQKIADSLPVIAPDALPVAVALQVELILGGKIYGWEFACKRFDCGTLAGLKNAEKFLVWS